MTGATLRRFLSVAVVIAALWLVDTGAAEATPITFTGSSGSLSASVTFNTVGTNLVVTLTNTSTADVLVPANVLTGVFFSIGVSVAPVSALLNNGSVVINVASQPAGGNVGGEWAYGTGLSGAPGGANSGISSSGLGLFNVANFGGPNLAPPPNGAVDGLQYGITSAGDDATTENGGTSTPLIQNSVVFTLSGLPSGFDPSTLITNVSFQYGTALDEPNIPGTSVPEPGSVLLLGSGLVGLGFLRRRMRPSA